MHLVNSSRVPNATLHYTTLHYITLPRLHSDIFQLALYIGAGPVQISCCAFAAINEGSGLLLLQCPHSVNRVSSYSKYVERTLFMEGRKKYQYNVNINVTNETLSSLYSLPLDRRLHASECAGK